MILKTEIYHVSIKECNLEIVTAMLPYCTSLVRTWIERRQRQKQTELGMSKNQYVISGVRVHACIWTQCIRSHDILRVLYLVLIYSDIDFNT